jgi:Outer membrane protein beta-barrel domain
MDDRRANIDIAFRNGLKDYEVLPPQEAWTNIQARVKRRRVPLYFSRAAAFAALALSVSVLAYRWNNRSPVVSDNLTIPVERTLSPVTRQNLAVPVAASTTGKADKTRNVTPNTIIENSSVPGKLTVADSVVPDVISVPESVLRMPESVISMPKSSISFNIVRTTPDLREFKKTPLAINDLGIEYQEYVSSAGRLNSKNRWSVAALASPTYYGKISTGSDQLTRQITSSEQPTVSYTGGVALAYKVNKRFSVQSGLFYSSLGQDLEQINSFSGFHKYGYTKGEHNFAVRTSNGTVTTNNPDVFLRADVNSVRIMTNYTDDVFDPQKENLQYLNNNMHQSLSYLELPVILRYKIIDRIIDINLIGGVSYNLLVNNSVYTFIEGGKYIIGTTEGLNMFSISSSVGMGMEYNFSGNFSLNLEPTFRYYINPFTNTGSGFHPYSFGIFSGISYKF